LNKVRLAGEWETRPRTAENLRGKKVKSEKSTERGVKKKST